MQCRSLLTFAALTALCTGAWSQAYREQPVKLVVPYAPDGSAEIVATAE